MRRMAFVFLTALMALALTAGLAFAAVNWKSGPDGSFLDEYTFNITGEASGLGNQPAIAHVNGPRHGDLHVREQGW